MLYLFSDVRYNSKTDVTTKPGDVFVVIGEHNRDVDEGTEKKLSVETVTVHENYDWRRSDNDIAVLRLAEDIHFDANIKPICLPKQDVPDNMECITTGWGDTQGRFRCCVRCMTDSLAGATPRAGCRRR